MWGTDHQTAVRDPRLDEAALLDVDAVWLAQYRGLAEARAAQGLSERWREAGPGVQRRAHIVEQLWAVRHGVPPPDLERLLDAAVEASLAAGDGRYAAIARYGQAIAAGRRNDFTGALQRGLVALQLCDPLEESARFERAVIHMGLGGWHKQLGHWSEALELLFQGLSLANSIDQPGLQASLDCNIGAVFFASGNYEDALETFLQAWATVEAFGVDHLVGIVGSNVARTYAALGRWQDAWDWVQPRRVEDAGATQHGSWMWTVGARAAAVLGLVEESRRWADEGLRMAAKRERPEELILALLADGQVHLAQANAEGAAQAFGRVADMVGAEGDPGYRLDAAEGLAQTSRLRGDAETAAAALATALALRERLAGTAARTRVAALKIRQRVDELAAQRDVAFQAQARAEAALLALQQTQAQLLKAQQHAMAHQLMTTLAHQLNTPLGICLTAGSVQQDRFAEMRQSWCGGAMRRSELEQFLVQGESCAALINSNVERLRGLVERFKRFSVHRFLTREVLSDVVNEALQAACRRHGREGSEFLAEVEPVNLDCDRQALAGLLAELLDNAVLARRGGDPPITVRGQAIATGVLLTVADRGPGMSAQQADSARHPYKERCSSGDGPGLGLGWSIVHHLASQMLDAQVELETALGQGVTVRIRLPLGSRE